ncbi:UDP-2,4-diacetamido-2,4,6-trideoxy-beta-L-altropyranose hydrolase [Alteromonas sp. M12]|uniref:UDP-2,4-diacetamido-2,4, 6-trideoxy-beta-L-altropyranose hydrolase n=1 Tax=Alteromonas sp. M12 TaxID=3135644 RepID=UPI00319E857D
MKHILFRVNAGVSSGLGHLMRCLALAQAAAKNQLTPVFMLNAEASKISNARQDWVGQTIVIPETTEDAQEIDLIAQFCRLNSVVAIVIDGYHFTSQYRQRLAQLDYPIICFDDMNNSGNLYADLIINGSGSAHQLKYDVNQPNTHLCIGESYRVLRQEFCEFKQQTFEQREYFTIIMGGSDPNNLTLPLLQCIEQKGFDGKLKVITGAAYPYLQELNKCIQVSELDIQHLHDCQQIAKSFLQTRLAISAAGGSQFELHATATPSCLVTVADNQLNATQAAVKQGWCIAEDFSKMQSDNEKLGLIEDVTARLLVLWSDDTRLLQMHNRALGSSDTNGSQRIIEKVKQLCFDGE